MLNKILKHYIYNNANQNIVEEIDVVEEIERSKVERPVLCIDMMALNGAWAIQHSKEMLCGGRPLVMVNVMTEFFRRLRDAGARLVFFSNFYTPQEECDSWIKKAEAKYEQGCHFLDVVYRKPTLHDLVTSKEAYATTNITHKNNLSSLWSIIKKDRVGKHINVRDIRASLASYAAHRKVFAVMSDSTEFLVFNGDYHVWSVNGMNFDRLTTKQFNKKRLSWALGLSPYQTKLLAVLVGGDLVPPELVSRFHRSVNHGRGHIIERLAKNVRDHSSLTPTATELDKISFHVVGKDEAKKKVLKSAYDYFNQPETYRPSVTESDPFLKRLADLEDLFFFQLLTGKNLLISTVFEDYRRTDLPSFIDITETLRRKLYGVLLFHKRGDDVTRHPTVMKLDFDTPFQKKDVTAILPDLPLPDVKQLMFPPKELTAEELQLRVNLLQWLISPKITEEWLTSAPKKYILSAVTVLFMVETGGCLSSKEADVFIWACYKAKDAPLQMKVPVGIQPRAFRLAFLFKKLFEMIRRAFFAVGWREACEDYQFDGFLFHHAFNKIVKSNQRIEQIEDVPECLRLYETLALAEDTDSDDGE